MTRGLKDHEIAKLINDITEEIQPISKVEWTRAKVHEATIKSLEEQGLRIDKEKKTPCFGCGKPTALKSIYCDVCKEKKKENSND